MRQAIIECCCQMRRTEHAAGAVHAARHNALDTDRTGAFCKSQRRQQPAQAWRFDYQATYRRLGQKVALRGEYLPRFVDGERKSAASLQVPQTRQIGIGEWFLEHLNG